MYNFPDSPNAGDSTPDGAWTYDGDKWLPTNQTSLASSYVKIAGDTMTGKLTTTDVDVSGIENLQKGATTAVEVITGAAYTVDFKTQQIATWAISANITINQPATAGEYGVKTIHAAVTGGPFTITLGAGVQPVGKLPNLAAGKTYEIYVNRSSDTLTTVSVALIGV